MYAQLEKDAAVLLYYRDHVYDVALAGASDLENAAAWIIMLRARQQAAQRIALFAGEVLGMQDCAAVLGGQIGLEVDMALRSAVVVPSSVVVPWRA